MIFVVRATPPILFVLVLVLVSVACSTPGPSAKTGTSWPAVYLEFNKRDDNRIAYTLDNRSHDVVKIDPLIVTEEGTGTIVHQISLQLGPGSVFSNSFPADPTKEHVATYQLHKGGETKVFTVEYRPAEEG